MLVGPHTFNFAEVTENLISDGAAAHAVTVNIHSHAAQRAVGLATIASAVERERGAVTRCVEIVAAVMAGTAP